MRWHALCAAHTIESSEEIEGEVGPWTDCFEIFRCQGCDSVHVRRSFYFALLGEEPERSYFPARISRHKPQWLQDLPDELRELLWEVYGALHADSPRLALMGIRAVVDVVILEKVGDVGTFREKLTALGEKGFVGRQQGEFLEAVLDAGSAAAHRGHAASAQELDFAMDIVENPSSGSVYSRKSCQAYPWKDSAQTKSCQGRHAERTIMRHYAPNPIGRADGHRKQRGFRRSPP